MAEDAEAIRRVLAGDAEMFRWLVERYERQVFRMVAGLVPDRHACEDLAQEAFLEAYRHLGTFDPRRAGFGTWLLTIARNLCLNAMRKKRPVPMQDPPDRPVLRTPPDDVAEREWMDCLDRALERLPTAQRTAFVLAEFLELPFEEIARIEGVRPATARANASKARRQLRTPLREFSGDES